jgi:hypothetical protein
MRSDRLGPLLNMDLSRFYHSNPALDAPLAPRGIHHPISKTGDTES